MHSASKAVSLTWQLELLVCCRYFRWPPNILTPLSSVLCCTYFDGRRAKKTPRQHLRVTTTSRRQGYNIQSPFISMVLMVLDWGTMLKPLADVGLRHIFSCLLKSTQKPPGIITGNRLNCRYFREYMRRYLLSSAHCHALSRHNDKAYRQIRPILSRAHQSRYYLC